MTVTLVSLCCLLLPLLATSQIDVILSADSNSTVAGDSFVFNCSANFTSLTLYIDGITDSPKANRVNTTDLGDNVTQYTFFDTVPQDNGTLFQCYADNFGSNDQTLIVYYPPIFAAGNNTSIWVEHGEDSNFTLLCNVTSANPPTYNMTYSNTSLFTDNVVIETERYVFSNGIISNRGNYTCYADNGVNESFINYWVFVGGDPNVTIHSTIIITDKELKIDVTVEDKGHAPATGVVIYIPHIITDNVTLAIERPIVYGSRTYDNVVNEMIDTFGPGEYNVSMNVFNQLATVSNVFTTTIAITSSPTHTTTTATSTSTTTITTSATPSQTPTSVPRRNNTGAVVAGVLIPILAIIVIAVAVVVGIIVYRQVQRRRRKEYALYHYENTDYDSKDYMSFKTT